LKNNANNIVIREVVEI